MTVEISLRGLRSKGTHHAGGILPLEMNELYLEIEVRSDEEVER